MTGDPWAGARSYDLMSAYSGTGESAWEPCCNDRHGTAVAGIIAATHDNGVGGAGIAPLVVVNAVRIFRGTQVATDNQIADGINWAWNVAKSDVINNSWGGGPPSNAITTAINNALGQGRNGWGTVVVFAAGNTSNRSIGLLGSVVYPASLSSTTNVISVGAINRWGELTNYTPEYGRVDVVAPSGHLTGFCIGEVVTLDRYGSAGCNDGPNGDINYTSTFSGTSAAAPQVSGVAALMLSQSPFLTAGEVKAKIRIGADWWGSASAFGAGKLNAYRALVQ